MSGRVYLAMLVGTLVAAFVSFAGPPRADAYPYEAGKEPVLTADQLKSAVDWRQKQYQRFQKPAEAVQYQLTRLGCLSGDIDGFWGSNRSSTGPDAFSAFLSATKESYAGTEPVGDVVALLKKYDPDDKGSGACKVKAAVPPKPVFALCDIDAARDKWITEHDAAIRARLPDEEARNRFLGLRTLLDAANEVSSLQVPELKDADGKVVDPGGLAFYGYFPLLSEGVGLVSKPGAAYDPNLVLTPLFGLPEQILRQTLYLGAGSDFSCRRCRLLGLYHVLVAGAGTATGVLVDPRNRYFVVKRNVTFRAIEDAAEIILQWSAAERKDSDEAITDLQTILAAFAALPQRTPADDESDFAETFVSRAFFDQNCRAAFDGLGHQVPDYSAFK
ncbi:MAG: hypothetical protein R3D33_12855 [Hyphomicrobiaceae bacterium]